MFGGDAAFLSNYFDNCFYQYVIFLLPIHLGCGHQSLVCIIAVMMHSADIVIVAT